MYKNKAYKKIICICAALAVLGQSAVCAYAESRPVSKDESVYVNLGLDGSRKSVIVSDWLHSDTGGKVEDSTILDNIKNVKGNEQPQKIGDKIIWNMQGNDIYYDGTTNKELPIDVRIKYYLDGNEINPEELGGKSGKIKITIQFINKDSHEVAASSGLCTLYTPFLVGAVVNLPVDIFKNVSVTDGKVISDGSNQVVAFASLPGLKESLGLDSTSIDELKDIKLPETFEINADANNFKLGPIMFAVTSGISELNKLKSSSNIGELEDNLDKLNSSLNDYESLGSSGVSSLITNSKNVDASRKLINDGEQVCEFDASAVSEIEGAANSANSLKTLMSDLINLGNTMNKNSQRIEDIKKFSKYTAKISNLASEIQGLGSDALTQSDIQVGLDAIFKNKEDQLIGSIGNDGSVQDTVKPVFESIVSQSFMYEEQLIQGKPVDNDALGIIEQAIAETLPTPENAGTLAQLNTLKTLAAALVNNDYSTLKALNMTEEQAEEAVKGGVIGILENQKNMYLSAIQCNKVSSSLKTGLSGIVTTALENQKNALMPEIASVMTNASSLNSELGKDFGSNYGTVLTNDMQFLQDSIPLIEDTMNQYNSNKTSINNITAVMSDTKTIDYLKDWAPKLFGMKKDLTDNKNILDLLRNFETDSNIAAANRLVNNMSDIQDQGKIDEYKKMAVDADTLLQKKDKIIELSDNYRIFTKASDDESTEVKFIMKTDEIQRPEAAVAPVTTEKSNSGFWAWLKKIIKKIF